MPKTPATDLPAVQPHLSLAAELVVLSLEHHQGRVKTIVGLLREAYGQPSSYHEVLESLEHAGLLTRHGVMRQLAPTPQAKFELRRTRLLGVIRKPAVPSDADGDLLVGLSACGALTLGQDDHLRARHRLTSLGEHRPLTKFVTLLCAEEGWESTTALVEALLPPERHFGPSGFDPGVTPGIWGLI